MGTFPDVRTLYAYTARTEEEMSFEGDVVLQISEKIDEHWWMARDDSSTPPKYGLVPSNYVDEIILADHRCHGRQQYKKTNVDEASYMVPNELFGNNKNNNNNDTKSAGNKTTSDTGVGFNVLTKFPYQAQRSDELSFKANMVMKVVDTGEEFQGWWTATDNQGNTGLIPGNYVEEIASSCISPSIKKPKVFSFEKNKADDGEEMMAKDNDAENLWKQRKADLLVERQNPFPTKKAEEAKASPGVKALTEKLVTEGVLDKRDTLSQVDVFSYQQEPYYFGKINRVESERILKQTKEGSFLIRDSESTVRTEPI